MRVVLRMGLAALGLALIPALSGCSVSGLAEPGSAFGGSDATAHSTPIFVASTRKGGSSTTELTPDARARYELDFVSVPPSHKTGATEMPIFGGPDAYRHFVLGERSPLEEEAFRAQVAAHLSGRIGVNRDVLVYVHGFNTSADQARFRLAQIVVDGRFGGVPVLFTWPSRAELLAYGADKESATASRDAYLRLLEDLSATPGVGRIHILAHSMGTWLTMETLRAAALEGAPDLHGKLGNVMLAAPDIDLKVFKGQMARLDPSHFSVFVSKGDRALQVSAGLQGDRRLGALDPGAEQDRDMIEALGVKVYDISDLSTNWIGHDSYAEAPLAVRQIGHTITAPRAGEAEQQAVIDAGADRSPQPPPVAPNAVQSSELAPLAAAPAPTN